MCKVTISAFDFLKKFPDAKTAQDYLEKRRWNGSPSCPKCSSKDRIQARKLEGGYYRCLACKFDFTVRTGTIFERSHVPLDKWLFAFYLVVTSRKGISSLQLSKELGVTQKTAWFMLQRIREACGNDNDDDDTSGGFLKGIIEADETYIGGKEKNKHASKKLKLSKGGVGKTIVFGMLQRGGKVKTQIIPGTSTAVIQGAIKASVEPGSTLCSDEHSAYKGMPEFTHKVVTHSAKQFVDGMAHTNGIESVWALLKRGFYGVYHSFSAKHLQRYLDEVTARLHEGNVKIHTMDRIDALLGKTIGARITYSNLIG